MLFKRILKRIVWTLIGLLLIAVGFFFYLTDTSKVDPKTVTFYKQLKDTLKHRDYKTAVFIVSCKRPKWYNSLLVRLGSGATSYSQHLEGKAIDIVVLDVNNNGSLDTADVNIVFSILDKEIVRNRGGVGTYKNMKGYFSKRMVHFDCRGKKVRWNK